MVCSSCPHLVRHGKAAADGKSIEFTENCGLKMRGENQPKQKHCERFPFPEKFDYMGCPVYLAIFKSGSRKNDVVPTKDFQFSEALQSGSITDMELL